MCHRSRPSPVSKNRARGKARPLLSEIKHRSPPSDAGNKGRYIRSAVVDRAIADHLADQARDDDGDKTAGRDRG